MTFRIETHEEIIDRCLDEVRDERTYDPDKIMLLELFRQVGNEVPEAQSAIFDGLRKWRGGP